LPAGRYQGGKFFSGTGEFMLSVNGNIWAFDVESKDARQLFADYPNQSDQIRVWMEETAGNFIIQDGLSYPIVYTGKEVYRADSGDDQVPVGRMMAYGNGRLWLALNNREVVAGDITQATPGSELKFTETTYLFGGGAFAFPRQVQALSFVPLSDTATGFGPLLVFGRDYTYALRAEILQRDLWQSTPSFQQVVFPSIGVAGQRNVVGVNQDVYFRSADGQLRSFRSARGEITGAGLAPLSREVSYLFDRDQWSALQYGVTAYFDNRVYTFSQASLDRFRQPVFSHIACLNTTPASTMQGKLSPVWEGAWTGLDFIDMLNFSRGSRERFFVVSGGETNDLWEMVDEGIDAESTTTTPIKARVDTPHIAFGQPQLFKQLARVTIDLGDIDSSGELSVYYRSDENINWTLLGTESYSTNKTPASVSALLSGELGRQFRRAIDFGSGEDEIDPQTNYSTRVGRTLQFRFEWTGRATIASYTVYAQPLPDYDLNRSDNNPSDVVEYGIIDDTSGYLVSRAPTSYLQDPNTDTEITIADPRNRRIEV
jgi:hypothetical protein